MISHNLAALHDRKPMKSKNDSELGIPKPVLSFRVSKTAMGLLLATVVLALLIGVSTYRNISRSRDMIEDFLVMKGETVIRSLEAGTRTSMMHHYAGSGDPLRTLIHESIRENDIAFITIMDVHGNVLDRTEGGANFTLSQQAIDAIMATGASASSVLEKEDIFTVSRLFEPGGNLPSQGGEPMGMAMPMMRGITAPMIITVGLATKEFDAARKQDMQHTLFMGAILFLVGSAGLYVLFLYQEMRIARSTLADLKIYTDNVIESMPAGLVTLDIDDRVISCNRKAEELMGSSLEEVHGLPVTRAFPGCDLDCARIRRAPLEHPAECRTADQRAIPVKISGSPLVNEEGVQTGTVLIIRDMSAIREMEQQLERSRHMAALGKMAAGVAHEIRNPLGTLRGFAHYFGELPNITEENRSYAELMKSEVDRLNRTVSGLLQFARPREPNFSSVDLDGLIAKTATMTEADLANKHLNFHYQCNTNIKIKADQDQLLQVLMNLLQNSVAATGAGGEISLRAAENARQVRISVSDNGCGMTDDEREKMFDPFFTTRKSGTGLGLAVSHQIIEQHNGSFEVESFPGKGTTITIILPRYNEEG